MINWNIIYDLLLQDGSVPFHWPLVWHCLCSILTKMYPFSQLYVAMDPTLVPLSTTDPLVMSERLSHITAVENSKTQVKNSNWNGLINTNQKEKKTLSSVIHI